MFATTFKKTLTAGALSASLALTAMTPTTASAQISDDDVAGIVALLLLGAVIHNNRRSNDHAQVTHPQQNDSWRVVPAHCRQDIVRRNGNTVRLFTRRCMLDNYGHYSRLPQECHIRFRNANNQPREGFRARCLRNMGFRTNRH